MYALITGVSPVKTLHSQCVVEGTGTQAGQPTFEHLLRDVFGSRVLRILASARLALTAVAAVGGMPPAAD